MPYYIVRDDGYAEYLARDGRSAPNCRKATRKELTLEAVAEMLDQEAENDNCDDFCGTHKALAALLLRVTGKVSAATRIMLAIADAGGLQKIDEEG